MSKTISSSTIGPVALGTADNPLYITSMGTVTSTGSADGIDGGTGTTWTITNAGVISASSTGNGVSLAGPGIVSNTGSISGDEGLQLRGGGSVTNNVGGSISGLGVRGAGFGSGAGVYITGAAGTVTNRDTISGVGYGVAFNAGGLVTNFGSITGGEDGVVSQTAATISNYGNITATVDDGVGLFAGGSVTNASGASITGAGSLGAGVFIIGGVGTVVNAGSITSPNHNAVLMAGGGSLSNLASGVISGPGVGVFIKGGAGTVTNAGLINGTGTNGTGVYLANGGSTTNASTGTIAGGQFGAFLAGGSTTLANYGSISGATYDGVVLGLGGTVTNAAGASISGARGGISVTYRAAGTVTNSGNVTASGTGSAGIDLEDGGSVTNNSPGSISGNAFGVFVTGASGTITNTGVITSTQYGGIQLVRGGSVTNGTGGLIKGGSTGIYIEAGAAGIITNSGSISAASASGAAVGLAGGGSITNNPGGSISGGAFGIFTTGTVATVSNGGSISGSHGVGLNAGGSVTNAASASISGQVAGVSSQGAAVTLSNAGSIGATAGAGADIEFGGSVTNLAGATLSGSSFGVFLTGGNGTVTNAGTISGGSYAVDFAGSGTNRLVVDPGAVFVGAVTGGSGTSTLELASGTGAISGVGTGSFNKFQALAIDTGGSWTLNGANVAPTLFDNGTVIVTGSLDVSTAIDPSSTGLLQLGAGATIEVAAATGTTTQIGFQDSTSELIIDNAALFGTNVGTASYAGPQLQSFVPGDKIDLKSFSSTGVTLSYNASTGVLQVSNSANQVASLEFQTSSLGGTTFTATSDGGTGIIITDPSSGPPPAPSVTSIATSGPGITNGNGDLNAGKVVTLTVNFSSAVTVNTANGSPTLTLSDNGTAAYVGGSGSTALTFSYTVSAGQNTPDLVVSSFNLNGATVSDVAGNGANLSGATNYNPAGALQIDTTAPTIAINTIAGNNIINATKASQGFQISGSTSGVENGQSVTVNILNSANAIVDTYTAKDTSNAWSVSVTSAQATALADGSYTVTANVSDLAGNPAPAATHALTVDEEKLPEAPALSIGNTSLTVQAGGSVPLGITATPVDSDDRLSVKISGVPGYEAITAPGYSVTKQLQSNGTYTWTITEGTSKAGTALTGLSLTSHYTGTGHPVATLTVTASNVTSGETATSASQTITMTDPPAIASNPSPSVLANSTGPQLGSPGQAPSVGSAPSAYTTLAALLDQYMAAPSGADAGLGRTALNIPSQAGLGDSELLAKPHA